MRNRFFFIILAALILCAVGMGAITVYFFEHERLALIDRRISTTSRLILESQEIAATIANDPEQLNEHISKVLGGRRIGHFFILKNRRGEVLYRSASAGLAEVDFPTEPEWNMVETPDIYVRYRNLRWPDTDLTLQVALAVGRGLLDWQLFDGHVISYIAGVVGVLFALSVALTLILLSPLRHLIRHLEEATSNLVNLRDVRPLPGPLTKFGHGFWDRSDEFASLIDAIGQLIDRINRNYKLTRSWTLQMAHELKTPLAVLRAETERASRAGVIPVEHKSSVITEIETMTNTISRFLDWAELESSQMRDDLHAIHVRQALESAAGRLDKISPNRLRLDLRSGFQVIANPLHFDQLVTNLLSNALKYSPAECPVEVTVEGQTLTIRDYGPGVPEQVKERLGQPFNVGSKHAGNGLGLAWVATVAKLYQWGFELESGSGGTVATIRFPFE